MIFKCLFKRYPALRNLRVPLVAAFLLTACAPAPQEPSSSASVSPAAVNIVGAGASFPSLVYSGWSVAYHQTTKKRINYQSIGSSAGIKQLNSRTIDFGATDAPLNDDVLTQKNYFQFPTVIGGIVMIVHIDGVKTNQLVLSGPIIAAIYQGKIKKWNHPAIEALNPELKLPNQEIAVVHRSDGSGTTQVFTKYLSQVSPDWEQNIGYATAVNWKTGIGGKGNDGVAIAVQTLKNSIGYVEFAYARQNDLVYTELLNEEGEVIRADPDSFRAATSGLKWEESFAQDLINNPAPGAWPLTTTTYIVVPKKGKRPQKTQEILRFFAWSFSPEGEKIVTSLDFVPLPPELIALIKDKWQGEFKDAQNISTYR